jgi:hypothetical protein
MATGDITMTLLYTGSANATALKTALDGQNEGTQPSGTNTADIIFLPMTAGQVAVWKLARSA